MHKSFPSKCQDVLNDGVLITYKMESLIALLRSNIWQNCFVLEGETPRRQLNPVNLFYVPKNV